MAELDESKIFINELLDLRINLIKTLFEAVGEDLGPTDSKAKYRNYMDQGFQTGYYGNASLAGVSVGDLSGDVFKGAKEDYLGACMSVLSKYGPLVGLTEKGQVYVLAQMAHESGNFRYTKEIGGERASYGQPRGPYGKRYYGRGPIQITHEYNYKAITEKCFPKLGINANIWADPDLCERNLEIGCAASLCWFMLGGNGTKAVKYANEGNVKELTRMINGGYRGLDERIKLTNALLEKTKL